MDDESLRRQLADLLAGNGAHMTFDEAVDDFPDEAINGRPPNVEYTPWHLLEHVRLTQADILDYVTNEAYVEPSWPADYWPARDAIATRAMFDETIRAFRADLASLRALVLDRGRDLFAVIPGTLATRCSARPASTPTTTRTTSANSPFFARSWAPGRRITGNPSRRVASRSRWIVRHIARQPACSSANEALGPPPRASSCGP